MSLVMLNEKDPEVLKSMYAYRRQVFKDGALSADDMRLLRFPRQALHAAVLEFRHPFTGELLRFESPFPDDLLTTASKQDPGRNH